MAGKSDRFLRKTVVLTTCVHRQPCRLDHRFQVLEHPLGLHLDSPMDQFAGERVERDLTAEKDRAIHTYRLRVWPDCLRRVPGCNNFFHREHSIG